MEIVGLLEPRELEKDEFEDLSLRAALTAGPGYQFIDDGDFESEYLSKMEFYAQAGIAFFSEDYEDAEDDQYTFKAGSVIEAMRVGLRSCWRMMYQTYLTLQRMLFNDVSPKNVGGIITIGAVSEHSLTCRHRRPWPRDAFGAVLPSPLSVADGCCVERYQILPLTPCLTLFKKS